MEKLGTYDTTADANGVTYIRLLQNLIRGEGLWWKKYILLNALSARWRLN